MEITWRRRKRRKCELLCHNEGGGWLFQGLVGVGKWESVNRYAIMKEVGGCFRGLLA